MSAKKSPRRDQANEGECTDHLNNSSTRPFRQFDSLNHKITFLKRDLQPTLRCLACAILRGEVQQASQFAMLAAKLSAEIQSE